MSIENPVDTVVRLLSNKMVVRKDDGSRANVQVSREWLNQEALPEGVDAHVTVGLAEAVDNKLELSGKLRRRVLTLRVNVWSKDSVMRYKTVEEVLRVVRENRNNPADVLYDFVGVGRQTGTHKAYSVARAELPPNDPLWTELQDADYQKIWYSDDVRYVKQSTLITPHILFRFKIDFDVSLLSKIVLRFEGYAVCGDLTGVTFRVWNREAAQWQYPQAHYYDEDAVLQISLTSNLAKYVDANGFLYASAKSLVVMSNTPTLLYCDYACCTATVKGISYLDVVGFRDVDRVDVKPFIYRTELVLKSWVFENIGV